MTVPPRLRVAGVLVAFAVGFILLCVTSFTRESATWDEPQHLTAGHTATALDDYRVDPEHPPLARKWCALPLRFMDDVKPSAFNIPKSVATPWMMFQQFVYVNQFLYTQNDADRLLNAGRFMMVLLGVITGVLLFCWAHELYGFLAASVALGMYMLEPNILSHARLVTTDFPLVCFGLGTVYFCWRLCRAFSIGNLIGLVGFFTAAQASKFSAVLLGPIVLALLLTNKSWGHVTRAGFGYTIRSKYLPGVLIILLALASWLGIWAAYGFRYLPGPGDVERIRMDQEPWIQERTPRLCAVIRWIDDRHLLPNACSQGFLLGQAKAQKRSAYLAGKTSEEGWWYYFPVAIAIKTPITLVLLAGLGIATALMRWRRDWRNDLFLIVPVVVFVGMGIATKLNIGLRHMLPIYPFLILLAAKSVAELVVRRQAPVVPIILIALAAELSWVYPHYLAFFNFSVGGPLHGDAYLVDSNLDWGQDLKRLKHWMVRQRADHINLSYFGSADPKYYGINATYLPGMISLDATPIQAPRLPGYVAVSVTNLRGVYLEERGKAFYRPFLTREPVVRIGYSINVYWVDEPWWQVVGE